RGARPLQAAERRVDQIAGGRAIDLDRSGFDITREFMHVTWIARRDRSRKAVFSVIRLCDGVGVIFNLYDCEDWSEYFFARDSHLLCDISEHGRRYIIPAFAAWSGHALAAAKQASLAFANLDVAQNGFELLPGCQGPQLVTGDHPAADLERLHLGKKFVGKDLLNLLHHQQPAGAGAGLPAQRQAALDGQTDRLVEVGILHD